MMEMSSIWKNNHSLFCLFKIVFTVSIGVVVIIG